MLPFEIKLVVTLVALACVTVLSGPGAFRLTLGDRMAVGMIIAAVMTALVALWRLA